MKRVEIALPEKQIEQLDAHLKKINITRSKFIRDMIARYLLLRKVHEKRFYLERKVLSK